MLREMGKEVVEEERDWAGARRGPFQGAGAGRLPRVK